MTKDKKNKAKQIFKTNTDEVGKKRLNLRILLILPRFMPMLSALSHRYLSKPSARRFTETKETCELSMAWVGAMVGDMSRHMAKKMERTNLELDASVTTVPSRLVQKIFQRLQNLLEEVSLNKPGLKHRGLYRDGV